MAATTRGTGELKHSPGPLACLTRGPRRDKEGEGIEGKKRKGNGWEMKELFRIKRKERIVGTLLMVVT